MAKSIHFLVIKKSSRILRIALIYGLATTLGTLLFESTAAYLTIHPDDSYPVLGIIIAICLGFGTMVAARSKWLNRKFEEPPIVPEGILSNREIQVFKELLTSKSNREISEALFIELSTLKTHVNRIYNKLDLSRRTELRAKYISYRTEK